jgi:hypothetical protein
MGERQSETATLTEVNAHIRDFANESRADEVEWDFFCECGEPDCRERITLTLDAYIGLHARGRAVLGPGHRPVECRPGAVESVPPPNRSVANTGN